MKIQDIWSGQAVWISDDDQWIRTCNGFYATVGATNTVTDKVLVFRTLGNKTITKEDAVEVPAAMVRCPRSEAVLLMGEHGGKP